MPNKKTNKIARKYTTITIPQPLFDNIKKSIQNTGFSSVSDWVTFVLRETMIDMENKDKNEKSTVIKKLEALGYTG
ncbi:MAG: CopG family transcriptional regulator [Candidatus Micrarchaeia archaeon]